MWAIYSITDKINIEKNRNNMVTNYHQEDLERLKEEVEHLVGRKIKSPKDFDFLSRQIQGYTHEKISISTLKRMWGYVASESNPSRFNLDLLSRMIGYPDWGTFVRGGKIGIVSSRFFMRSKLIADALDVGDEVKLTWNFGRIVTIKYQGNDTFEVLESKNSKLAVGDTFVCHQFVADEPCYLSNLRRTNNAPTNYVCGSAGGFAWYLPRL